MPMLTTLRMRLPVKPFHSRCAHIGEFGHLIEDGMDFGYNVLAVHHYPFTTWDTQRHMQHRPFSVRLILSPRNIASIFRASRFRRPG